MHRLICLFVFYLGVSVPCFSQQTDPELKIDPRINKIQSDFLNESVNESAKSASLNLINEHNELIFPVIITGNNIKEAISINQFPLIFIENMGYGRLTFSQINEISLLKNVSEIKLSSKSIPLDDLVRTLSGVSLLHDTYLNNTTYKGAGVLIGIIDTGLDFTHKDFRKVADTTKSRVISIWDQTLIKGIGESNPKDNIPACINCNFGVEYQQAHINDEIDGTPTGYVRQRDVIGHGTHVTGTAAGNGNSLAPAKNIGMAPEADILVVKTTFLDVDIATAIEYLRLKALALNKPLVINLSLGTQFHAHDGIAFMDKVINAFSGPGKVVVCAAGNDGLKPIHVSQTILDNDTAFHTLNVPVYTANPGLQNDILGVGFWQPNADSSSCYILSPSGYLYAILPGFKGYLTTLDGDIYAENSIDTTNGKRYIDIEIGDFFLPTVTPGNWKIKLFNYPLGGAYTYHGWLYSAIIGASTATITGGNSQYTIMSPSSADSAICVGAYTHRWNWSDYTGTTTGYGAGNGTESIATFSSIGPLVNNKQKPDITAFGMGTIGSLSAGYNPGTTRIVSGQKHYITQGTSMASPVVSGVCALLLQRKPTLRPTQIKSIFAETALVDAYTTGLIPNAIWGYGKLDAFRAMAKVIMPSLTSARKYVFQDNITQRTSVTVNGVSQHASKITIPNSGYLTSFLFHTSATNPTFANPITFNIHQDSAGFPGPILKTYSYASALYQKNNWNIIPIPNFDFPVTAAQILHFSLTASGNSYGINRDATNLSKYYLKTTGNWITQTSGSLIYRLITTINPIPFLPVDLVYFNAENIEKNASLTWLTSQEINNYGFEIQKLVNGEFKKIGFVKGNGNSNQLNNYSFLDYRPGFGTFFYRLKQIDFDGKVTFSEIEKVVISEKIKNQSLTALYDANGNVVLQVINQKPQNVFLFDCNGKKVFEWLNVVNHDAISIPNYLPKGVYFAITSNDEEKTAIKVLLF